LERSRRRPSEFRRFRPPTRRCGRTGVRTGCRQTSILRSGTRRSVSCQARRVGGSASVLNG
jgi:hypothetical protein